MNRSTTSVASSHTEVDRYERSLRTNDGNLDVEKHSGGNDEPASTAPTATPSPDPAAKSGPIGPPGTGGPGPNDLYQPKSLRFWLILVANFLAMFLVALDRTIVATAIPRITDDFHSLGDIGWYGSAYMLTTAASQLVFGRLYKHYNMKW